MKTIVRIDNPPARHWVGDGFPVHGMFGYHQNPEQYSPFLMMDYAAPYQFPPNLQGKKRGVGEHPHRGFETVTIVYNGEVAHRDSAGGGGVIGVGDVQWMTAGRGIVHDEFHSDTYSQSGGAFEMVQLWVNLPAKDKMTQPGYQAIVDASIPIVASQAAQVRVIAGTYADQLGPAKTHTPMNVWGLQIKQGQTIDLPQPSGWTTLLLVQKGSVKINHAQKVGAPQLVVMSREGSALTLQAQEDAKVLLLAGEPIDEPVFGYGPFVMNTREEIMQAINDFNSGKFGRVNQAKNLA
jgi:quercetin 2,3-dioxygenase